ELAVDLLEAGDRCSTLLPARLQAEGDNHHRVGKVPENTPLIALQPFVADAEDGSQISRRDELVAAKAKPEIAGIPVITESERGSETQHVLADDEPRAPVGEVEGKLADVARPRASTV